VLILGRLDLRLHDAIEQDAITLDDVAGQLRRQQLADRQVGLGDLGSGFEVGDGHGHIDQLIDDRSLIASQQLFADIGQHKAADNQQHQQGESGR